MLPIVYTSFHNAQDTIQNRSTYKEQWKCDQFLREKPMNWCHTLYDPDVGISKDLKAAIQANFKMTSQWFLASLSTRLVWIHSQN